MKSLLKIKGLQSKWQLALVIGAISSTLMAKNPFPPSYTSFLDDCDACGCSNNGGSLGMGAILDIQFVGLRYLYQKYESKTGIFDNSPTVDEAFNTLQLWSRIPLISNVLEVQLFVPWHEHNRQYTTKELHIRGIGDISLLANYTLWEKRTAGYDRATDKIDSGYHLLKVGAGVKLPTGKYNETIDNTLNPSFQLGTGSTDFIGNLQYLFKRNSWGLSNVVTYYAKGSNANKYRFGNQFNFNSTFFYVFKDNTKNVLVPSLSVSGEFYQENKVFGIPVKNTSGQALFTTIGAEYTAKRLTLGVLAMYPIAQNLAQGFVEVKHRTSVYINYNL